MLSPTHCLREIRSDEYQQLYEYMKRDFPSGELPPFFSVKSNLSQKVYDGFFLSDAAESAAGNACGDIGYALLTAPKSSKYALLNFFAICPRYRSKGYGTAFLEILGGRYPVIVLEAEDPAVKTDGPRDTALKRIRFYERAGYRVLPTQKAKIFGVDMLIMTNAEGEVGSVRELMHSLYLPAFGTKRWLRFINIKD